MSVSAELTSPWSWTLEGLTPPWGDRPSLYQHVLAHIRPGEPGLAPGGEELGEALRACTRKASSERATALYELLADGTAIEYVDHLLSAVLADDRLPHDRLREVAR